MLLLFSLLLCALSAGFLLLFEDSFLLLVCNYLSVSELVEMLEQLQYSNGVMKTIKRNRAISNVPILSAKGTPVYTRTTRLLCERHGATRHYTEDQRKTQSHKRHVNAIATISEALPCASLNVKLQYMQKQDIKK